MNRVLGACLGIALPLVVLGCAIEQSRLTPRQEPPGPSALQVQLKRDRAADYILAIDLKYGGTTNLSFFYEYLPWYKDSIVLVAVSTRYPGGRVLKRMPDPAGTMWVGPRKTVEPGQTVQGQIRLEEWFPELSDEVAVADVLLFWSYLPPPHTPLVAARQSGFLTVPKRE